MKNVQKMYVVMEHRGQYDDACSNVVCVSDNREKAFAYADKMNATFASMSQKMVEFDQTVLPAWERKHEVKPSTPKGLREVPKWPSGSIVTDAMRQERIAIQEHNRKIIAQHDEPRMRYFEAREAFTKEWMRQHLTEEECLVAENRDHNEWVVCEDVPML